MAWSGGKNWVRKEPTISMLELLTQVAAHGTAVRLCTLRRHTGRRSTHLRESLARLEKLELVTRGRIRIRSQWLPTYTVTPKGAQYL